MDLQRKDENKVEKIMKWYKGTKFLPTYSIVLIPIFL